MKKGISKIRLFSFFFSIVLLLSLNARLTFASGNPCDQLTFCLADAFNTSGNETIIACAGTPASVNWFNIWYNGTILNDTNGGIVSKQYYTYNNGYDGAVNGTNYNNELINGNTTPHCVRFVLNGTNAPFTNKTIQINATVFNSTNYATALGSCGGSGCNASMFTINYISIETKNSDGSAFLPNTAILAFNNVTKTFTMNGPALTDSSGYWAEHCWGVVQNGNCVNVTAGVSPNWCFVHGVNFPLNDSNPICPINQTTTIRALDFIYSNMSSDQNVTNSTAFVTNLGTPSAMSMVMAFAWNPDNQMQQMSQANLSSMKVYDYNTDSLLFNLGNGGNDGPPPFLQPYTLYKINFSYGVTNYNFPFMTPIAGMTGAQVLLANTTPFPQNSTGYRTIIGKIVNETKNTNGDYYPVAGAVVYAQFFKGPGGAFGIQFFNSSVTDANGIFTMRVPRSRAPSENQNMQGGGMYFPLYQFYIVSNQTNNNIPIYFPTIDNNKNKGYFAIGDTVVLPPLTLKAGGQVNVNVTLNNASMVMSELSKFATPATGVITNGTTGKFAMTSMFSTVNPPSSMIMSLLSPTYNDTNPNLVVDLFGKNNSLFGGGDPMSGSIVSACFNNTFNVTQGVLSNIICNLTNVGYLNLTVQTCTDIFTQSGCNMQMQAGRFDFWFEMNGIIRNSNNQVVSYLSPEGVLLENLVGQSQSNAISIPLPPGNYTLELASPMDFSRYLGVYNRTEFAIAAGATTILNLTRANSWNIQPMFNPSLSRSDNSLNVSIMNAAGSMLNNTSIILTGKVLRLSKFAANDTIIAFSYDPVRSVFYNNTFNPGSYNLNGKYLFMLNATNVTSNVYYTTNQFMPINIFDFQVGVDLGGFTFGTGQNVSAKVFAYNASANVGLNASSGNVTTTIYDESGSQVTVTTSASSITNGQGTINITMPGTLGFYEIVTSVTTDGCVDTGCTNNTFGVSDNWVQISNLNVKVSTDKQNYQTTDTVSLTVQISNATNGSAITGVSIEAVIDNGNTPSLGTTGSDGKAIINLNPSLLLNSTTGTWSYGWHSIRVKISGSLGTNVFKVDTWTGFDVRGFDLFIRPDKPSYGITDNVTIAAYGPLQSFSITGVKVDSTTLTQGPLDNCNVTQGVTFCIDTAWGTGSNNIKIGNWSVGHHNVEITVSFGGSQQKFYTGFDVSNYNVIATTDSFTYNLNQNITLNIKASYTNGTALNYTGVNVSLWKAQPPNDIFVTTAGGTTNSTGQITLKLNATQPGFNFLKIYVGAQLQFIGVQVSSLKVTLLNATGGSVVTNYNAMPGSTTNIYVNATSGNSNVPDGSTVTAAIWSFGNRIDLPSNTTTNGNTTIPVQIPSFAPSQVYGLEIIVTTPTGEQGFAPPATLTVTGGSALQLRTLSDRSFSNPYKTGDNATLIAILSYPNGTGASGQNITFEVGSEGSRSQTIGTSVTGNDGKAASSFTITNNYTDGPYFLHAYITNSTDVQDYSGFLISSLKVNVATDRSNNTYSPGENITLNITLLNTTGSQINATNGFVFIFNKNKGQIQQTISTSGSQPYQAIIAVPNESSAIGTYPIGVIMFSNQSQGTGSAMIDVKSSSNSLNLTLPSSITAGTSFLANISSSLNGTATFRVFSPTASSLVYENTSVSLGATSTPNASINLTISNPGVYVFNAFVNGIGSTTSVITVSPPSSGTIPSVWTYTSVSNSTTNTSSFTVQDVYIMSNIANTTATILTLNTTTNTTLSYSVPLSLNSSTTYYGKLDSSNLVSGRKYFVRLDSSTSTGLSKTMFSVS